MKPILLDGQSLSRDQLVEIAYGASVGLDAGALKAVARAADFLAEQVRREEPIYGVSTGFGSNADKLLGAHPLRDELPGAVKSGRSLHEELQNNLIITHAVCVGEPMAPEVVRAMMGIRINTLLRGHSGIRVQTLESMAAMLNAGIVPVVPELGSVGASGDLAPLSHLALVLLGGGEAFHEGERMPGAQALQRVGLAPVTLSYKEGLALNNGTAQMLAMGVLAVHKLDALLDTADLAAAMTIDAFAGRLGAFAEEVHALRPHPGQVHVAAQLRRLLSGSTLADIPYHLGQLTPSREFDFPRAREGGLDVAFMSIYTSPEEDRLGTARQVAHMQIDSVEAMVGRHPDKFALLTSPGDLERLRAGNRVLLTLGMENGAPLVDDLAQLAQFHARGVRYITLAHSTSNRISDSSYDSNHQWQGLSPFGKEVVAEMNRLGIMVDVSHLSDAATAQAVELSRVPVIASHSGMRHFTPGFERNLSDELAKAIAAKGGVVHIVFGIGFVNPQAAADLQAKFVANAVFHARNADAAKAGKPLEDKAAFDAEWNRTHPTPATSIDAVVDQIDYAAKLIGIDHVGIGSDFDGVDGKLPEGLRNVADYPNLIAGLQARGYKDDDLKKILGGNLLRVWAVVEAGSEQPKR